MTTGLWGSSRKEGRAMTDEQSIRDEIADEISGIVVGSGYYSTFIGIDAAQEAADAIMPLVRKAPAEAWDEAVEEMHALGWLHDFAKSDALARNPYRKDQ